MRKPELINELYSISNEIEIAVTENMTQIMFVYCSVSDSDAIADKITEYFCDDDTAVINTLTDDKKENAVVFLSYEN